MFEYDQKIGGSQIRPELIAYPCLLFKPSGGEGDLSLIGISLLTLFSMASVHQHLQQCLQRCLDFGLDPDFFDQICPDFCQKSGIVEKLTK